MSTPHTDVLKELETLQRRIDEIRGMLRTEVLLDEIPDGVFHVLICRTDREAVGILLRDIEEVLPMCSVTPVPDAPSWLTGVLNLGGEMVPVLDLNGRIAGVAHQPDVGDSIVICLTRGKRLGLVVSEVVGVEQMNRGDVQEVSERLVSSPYLLGMSDLGGSPMLMLSVPSLLSSSEIPEGVL